MRRFQKQQLLNIIKNIHSIHQKSREKLEQKEYEAFQLLLEGCQSTAIKLGEAIEQIEGEGTETVSCLEQYCEEVYLAGTQTGEISPRKTYKMLETSLINAENALKHMPERIEAVFLPYKASMWDSLESVWMAADRDPNCDAYVIPIPYYDKNPDGSFKEVHYEGEDFPDYVQVTHYDSYNFENRRPDMIYIHNPYDQYNNVTSVHPFFYSLHLKQFTDMLVYIPYYSTSGGMNPGQGQCSAYYCADYIVIQAEKYRKYFDPDIPADKLLPLGSPKFDRVVNICNNPPEPPEEWKEKMAGKKVYFYNTSINGMLANTSAFLKKMEYVFSCFAGRQDACLLWRPHPLLESTFDSMRSEYKPIYESLKKYFIKSDFGIYDDTPDITNTIALCDAYIGDAASSVTSLFGIVGKPVFVLDNNIDCAPGEDDWRGNVLKGYSVYGATDWKITQGNKLYYSSEGDYKYEYYCDLSEYAYGGYYLKTFYIGGKAYVCPASAQDILVVANGKIEKKIELIRCTEQTGAFKGAAYYENYIFLIPNKYPAVVIYNTLNDEVRYVEDHMDVFIGAAQGERRIGGYCVQNGYLFMASPINNQVLAVCAVTGKAQVLTTGADNSCGCVSLNSDGTDLWFLPYEGYVVTRWNPETGEVHEYSCHLQGLKCKYQSSGYECMKKPFSNPAFTENYVYLPPFWGNMYVRLDKRSGEAMEWKPPFALPDNVINGYYYTQMKANFITPLGNDKDGCYLLFSYFDRKLYSVNLETGDCREIEILFQTQELLDHEAGFMETSEWLRYACQENAFNSLTDFLDGKIAGGQFDRSRAIRAYGEIAANSDGTSGTKIYEFVHGKCLG